MNRKTICSLVLCCTALAAFGAVAQSPQGGDIKQDAKAVGHDVADGARDVGHAGKRVGKKIGHGAAEAGTGIGHGAKKAGIAIGHGAREGWGRDPARREGSVRRGQLSVPGPFALSVVCASASGVDLPGGRVFDCGPAGLGSKPTG
ncbi:hypothetical protein [Rhodanobacter lindaniclasticus]